MTLKKMQACAAETLSYFMHTMPDVPFTEDDTIIEFVPKKDMVKRAKSLCAEYVPDKVLNESQVRQLANSITANALVGKEKSAVIVRIDYKQDKRDWKWILFHEFIHIFCAKSEMDGEHFIEIYGSGTTPEIPDMTHEEKTYDGLLVAGYFVWSEFIAQYYALTKAAPIKSVADVSDYVNHLLGEVNLVSDEDSRASFAMACSTLLACRDAGETVSMLNEPDEEMPETQKAFICCLTYLHNHLQGEKPWKINEEFIAGLGNKFLYFKMLNSLSVREM